MHVFSCNVSNHLLKIKGCLRSLTGLFGMSVQDHNGEMSKTLDMKKLTVSNADKLLSDLLLIMIFGINLVATFL
jgi:hypothetical protein